MSILQEKQIRDLELTNRHLKWQLLMVSKLSSDEAKFFNPFNADIARHIRDRVLETRSKNTV